MIVEGTAIVIRYDPIFGEPVSDGAVQEVIERLFESINSEWSFSTSNIFTAVRLFIVEHYDDNWAEHVFFEFNGSRFQANEYGAIVSWPQGFCDLDVNMSTQIVIEATRKRQFRIKERIANKENRP